MLNRATAELTLDPSTIYNEEREKFLNEYLGTDEYQLVHDMLSDIKKDVLKKGMWRARQDVQDLQQWHQDLQLLPCYNIYVLHMEIIYLMV